MSGHDRICSRATRNREAWHGRADHQLRACDAAGNDHGGDLVMTGAIVTLAVGAVLCSALATLGNHAIAREFRDFDLIKNTEILMDPVIAVRYAEYRLATNIFYR